MVGMNADMLRTMVSALVLSVSVIGTARAAQAQVPAAAQAKPAAAAEELKDAKGKVFARVKREGRAARIDFAPGVDPAFIDEAAALLAERYAAFADGTKK